jgi:vacuole morphology and inheritance protein 14
LSKDLRLHLLEIERNQYLVRALYGLLMILPQSDAFILLKQRLDCVPNYYNKITDIKVNNNLIDSSSSMSTGSENNPSSSIIDFKQLLQYFIQVQEKHKFFKKSTRISMN